MVEVESWGRLQKFEHTLLALSDLSRVQAQIIAAVPGLAFGCGRSYGDVCLNPGGLLWGMSGLDRFIAFDSATGVLHCEAGMTLRDIQRMTVPRGWILPVTPGTQNVTVGGAIANDIHGKNHHLRGTFGHHVRRIALVRTDGERIECGPDKAPDWFAATVGGMGLTGVIVEAEIQLQKVGGPWLLSETIPHDTLDEFFSLSNESLSEWEYSVSWIDCLSRKGRGIFQRANPLPALQQSSPIGRGVGMPFVPPVSLVNRWTLRPFNAAYYLSQRRRMGANVVHYEPFFYPLDNVRHWNRMYGPRGFYQYQCVLPKHAGAPAIEAMLVEIARSGQGSFLAVLKNFGDRPPAGLLSFPRAGTTLALDFPNHGESTLELFRRLDAIVKAAAGRIYPAKDARMSREMFEAGFENIGDFLPYRDMGIRSAMSQRLMGF